ncbi:MAG: hypothetical protein AAF573_07380 [Bacteroidota bacterium]
MRVTILFFLLSLLSCAVGQGQEKTDTAMDTLAQLPFREIPEAPNSYTAEGVAARMIDGLGFRYYWATIDLRDEDLNFRPGETNRTTLETLEHIYNLSKTIRNGTANTPNIRGGDSEKKKMNYAELRKATLENLKAASDLLRGKEAQLEHMNIIFQRGERQSEFPFWNMINGPIADALWHAGQVVSNRRASGNPLPPGVSVFTGKTKQ